MSDTFVVVDGNSLMHRAFHALPPLSNEDGVFTNAVFGFLSMLLKVVGDERPRYLAVAFDMHGPTFRHKDYSEYKAGRKPTAPELIPQFDLVRQCLEQMGIRPESSHHEEGPGQNEIDYRYADPLTAAENAVTFQSKS